MITCNGILGLPLLIGAVRRHIAVFNPEGTGGAFATVGLLAAFLFLAVSP
jgi:Ca2+:H+ antiporter